MVGRLRVAEKCFANGAKRAGAFREVSQYAPVGERVLSCCCSKKTFLGRSGGAPDPLDAF